MTCGSMQRCKFVNNSLLPWIKKDQVHINKKESQLVQYKPSLQADGSLVQGNPILLLEDHCPAELKQIKQTWTS